MFMHVMMRQAKTAIGDMSFQHQEQRGGKWIGRGARDTDDQEGRGKLSEPCITACTSLTWGLTNCAASTKKGFSDEDST
jgi:hypothetical protein